MISVQKTHESITPTPLDDGVKIMNNAIIGSEQSRAPFKLIANPSNHKFLGAFNRKKLSKKENPPEQKVRAKS